MMIKSWFFKSELAFCSKNEGDINSDSTLCMVFTTSSQVTGRKVIVLKIPDETQNFQVHKWSSNVCNTPTQNLPIFLKLNPNSVISRSGDYSGGSNDVTSAQKPSHRMHRGLHSGGGQAQQGRCDIARRAITTTGWWGGPAWIPSPHPLIWPILQSPGPSRGHIRGRVICGVWHKIHRRLTKKYSGQEARCHIRRGSYKGGGGIRYKRKLVEAKMAYRG